MTMVLVDVLLYYTFCYLRIYTLCTIKKAACSETVCHIILAAASYLLGLPCFLIALFSLVLNLISCYLFIMAPNHTIFTASVSSMRPHQVTGLQM